MIPTPTMRDIDIANCNTTKLDLNADLCDPICGPPLKVVKGENDDKYNAG